MPLPATNSADALRASLRIWKLLRRARPLTQLRL